jgi:hypothetical protein
MGAISDRYSIFRLRFSNREPAIRCQVNTSHSLKKKCRQAFVKGLFCLAAQSIHTPLASDEFLYYPDFVVKKINAVKNLL